MGILAVEDSGLIYANPRPFWKSRQAIFPTVVDLGNDELLAAFTVGEAFESADGHTELARSIDGGRNWTHEGPLPRTPTPHPTSESGRLSRTASGAILCYGPRFDRTDPERAIGNAETNGFLDCEGVWYRSDDGGRTWGDAQVVPFSTPGAYEIASPIVPLSDGRWLAPFSTFPDWEGVRHIPERALAMVSHDEGATWPDTITTLSDPAERIVFWEQRIIDIGGGRLLALAWAHDKANGKDRPDHYSVSEDGIHFGPPRSTGIPGQTCSPVWLDGDRVLCAYNHRYGDPGVRARLCSFDPACEWPVEEEIALWGQPPSLAGRKRDTIVGELNHLRFGFPMALALGDGGFLVSHWCFEDAQLVCRWTRLRVDL